MRYFDRPSGRARIDMGGNSRRQPSAAELVAALRVQREMRERERRRDAAARALQAALRASLAARTAAAGIAARLAPQNASSSSSSPPQQQQQQHPPPARPLPASLAPVALVLAAAAGYVPGFDAPPTSFRVRDASFVRNALALRLVDPQAAGGVHVTVKAAVVFLAAAVDGPPELAPACLSRATRLLRELQPAHDARPAAAVVLREWPFFDLVARLLRPRVSAPAQDQVRPGAIRALIDAGLDAAASDEAVWGRLFANVLTVDEAASFLKMAEGPPAFATTMLRQLSLCEMHFDSYQPENLAALFGNVLYLGKRVWRSRDPARLWPLVSVVARILHGINLTSLESCPGMDEDEDDVEDDEGPRSVTASGVSGGSDIQRMSVSAAGASTSDANIMDARVVKRLFSSLASVVSDDIVRSLFIAAVLDGRMATVRVCKLFNALTRRKPQLQMTFKSVLAFWRPAEEFVSVRSCPSPNILPHLWLLCRKENGTGVDLADDGNEVLLVFVRAYSHFLYVQDDDEMFETQRPFTTIEIRDIAMTLKKVLFDALWTRTPSDVSVPSETRGSRVSTLHDCPGLVDDVARLMSRLYICDSRHQFRTSDDFWIAGGAQVASEWFVLEAVVAGVDGTAGDSGALLSRSTSRNPFTFSGAVSRWAGSRKQSVSGAGDLLRVAPYMVPFSSRARIFHTWVAAERDKHGYAGGSNRSTITVRRNFLFEDAFDELNFKGEGLKSVIRVKFIDEHGLEEAGIDGGGVYKEFMYEVLRRAFSPSLYGLFLATSDGHLYPSPDSHVVDELYIQRYEFVGRLLGKALFDGVLVDVPLASFFLSKLLHKFNYPSDLKSLDPELYRNLMFLRKCDPEVVESLELNFVATNNAFGAMEEVELIRGGRNVPVTSQNRIEYIHRISNYRMNIRIRRQCDAFVRGFSEVIRPEYIRLFSERELQLLISGSTSSLDLADLRRHTAYSGGYNEDSDVIHWFWQVVSEMSTQDQTRLLQFVTSSPRAPLLGFAYLYPSFCIHRAGEEERLPSASTCMNLLKLPDYKDLDTLRTKLLYSISANTGFSLS